MKREYYSASIADFRNTTSNEILGQLTRSNPFTLEQTQLNAWLEQITILQRVLTNRDGRIYFEYAIPRMGKRIDVVLLIGPVIFVLEFKIGERDFTSSALDHARGLWEMIDYSERNLAILFVRESILLVSHSQTVITFQPCFLSISRFRRSRSTLDRRLVLQNSAFVAGTTFPYLQGCI